MIGAEVYILVCVGGFTVHCDMCTPVLVDVYTGILEGQSAILLWLSCELYVGVQAVDMCTELIDVVFVDHGKCIVHVSEPY